VSTVAAIAPRTLVAFGAGDLVRVSTDDGRRWWQIQLVTRPQQSSLRTAASWPSHSTPPPAYAKANVRSGISSARSARRRERWF
jgi:hypothetical protein